jgi:hypothetical protein
MIETGAMDQHDGGQALVELAAAGRRENLLSFDG